jgi:hypothetical protein
MTDHKALFKRVTEIMNRGDWDALREVYHDDYVEEYPQSGEVIRGLANVRAIREKYPGGGVVPDAVDTPTSRVISGAAEWVRTPAFTVYRVGGTGDTATATFRSRYPDGSTWWIITIFEVRGDKIAKGTMFFAPMFDPPDWRAAYREPR